LQEASVVAADALFCQYPYQSAAYGENEIRFFYRHEREKKHFSAHKCASAAICARRRDACEQPPEGRLLASRSAWWCAAKLKKGAAFFEE